MKRRRASREKIRRRLFSATVFSVAVSACAEDEIVVLSFGSGGATPAIPLSGNTAGPPIFPNGSGGTPSSGGRLGSGGTIHHGATGGAGGRLGSGGTSPNATGGAMAIAGAAESGGAGTGGAGGTAFDAGPGASCSSESDCPSGWTCSKTDCAATNGVCAPRPVLCDLAPLPVCGCDGITYWNDCVRRQNGVAAATFGQCSLGALACNVAADCGVATAFCSHVFPSPVPCTQPGPGTCWVTPLDCSGAPTSPRWVPCAPPPFGTRPQCVDTCTAIRSGDVYVPAPTGTCP